MCQVERVNSVARANPLFYTFRRKKGEELDIIWFGRRCFSIRSRDLGVVTDPYDQVLDKVVRAPFVKAVTWSGPRTGPPSLFATDAPSRPLERAVMERNQGAW